MEANYVAMMGNLINLGGNGVVDGVHGIRVSSANYVILSNNTWPAFPGISYRDNSQYGVVSDNKLTVGNGAIHFEVANDTSPAVPRDVIFERNMLINTSVRLAGTELTARNNIFYYSGGTMFAATNSRYVSGVAAPRPNNLWVYNNTVYSLATGTSISTLYDPGYGVEAATTAITLRNNIVYAPNSTTPLLTGGTGTATITASNNTTNIKTQDPLFTNGSGLFNIPSDFALQTGSYGVNTGMTIPGVFSDFIGNIRPLGSAYDMGAYER